MNSGYDVRQHNFKGSLWVVQFYDGTDLLGTIVPMGSDHFASLHVWRDGVSRGAPNADIEWIKPAHAFHQDEWLCYFGFSGDEKEFTIRCESTTWKTRIDYVRSKGIGKVPIVFVKGIHGEAHSIIAFNEVTRLAIGQKVAEIVGD